MGNYKWILGVFLIGLGCSDCPLDNAGNQAKTNESENLKLWYEHPAGDVWEEALPLGNGRLGAMVYGNPSKEILQLNEETVWSGGPSRNDNPKAKAALSKIRELIFAGEYAKAQKLAGKTIQSTQNNGQIYQPVGNVYLEFPGHEHPKYYKRELNLENAIATTQYKVAGVTYTREAFISIPDQIIVMKLLADKPGQLSFTASMDAPQLIYGKKQIDSQAIKIQTNSSGNLELSGTTSDHEGVNGQVKFSALAHIKTKNGKTNSTANTIKVKNADEATLYISIATNFKNYENLGGDEKELSNSY